MGGIEGYRLSTTHSCRVHAWHHHLVPRVQEDVCRFLHILPLAKPGVRQNPGIKDPFTECLLHEDVHGGRDVDSNEGYDSLRISSKNFI